MYITTTLHLQNHMNHSKGLQLTKHQYHLLTEQSTLPAQNKLTKKLYVLSCTCTDRIKTTQKMTSSYFTGSLFVWYKYCTCCGEDTDHKLFYLTDSSPSGPRHITPITAYLAWKKCNQCEFVSKTGTNKKAYKTKANMRTHVIKTHLPPYDKNATNVETCL